MSAVLWTVREVLMEDCPYVSDLSTLVSWVKEQQEDVASLQVDRLMCGTREDRGACMDLLERCTTWHLDKLEISQEAAWTWNADKCYIDVEEPDEGLELEVKKFWSRLAVVVGRGKVGWIVVTRDVEGMAEQEDLVKVQEATEHEWTAIEEDGEFN